MSVIPSRGNGPSQRYTTKDQLRVLFYLFFPGGGIGKYSVRLMSELVRQGIEVEAAVVPEFAWRDQGSFKCWPNLQSISHPIPIIRRSKFLAAQLTSPLKLLAHVRHTHPDVVHLCNINYLTFAIWRNSLRKTGVPVVATVHDVRRQKAIIVRKWEEHQLIRFYRNADWLFIHSEEQKKVLREFASLPDEKVTVVPHGPTEYPQSGEPRFAIRRRMDIPENANLGLAFGQVRDEKNLANLLQSLTLVSENVHILVAGTSVTGHRPLSYYKEFVQASRLSGRVHFLEGFVPEEKVGDLFLAADWVALTYSRGFTSQSGVLNCAVHFHKPVLVTPCSSFVEALSECRVGVVCENDQAEGIASGLKRLLEAQHHEDVFQFEEYLATNSWQRNASETIAIYHRLKASRQNS